MRFNSKRYLAVFLLYVVAPAGCKPAAGPAPPAPRSASPPGRNRLPSGFYGPADRGGPRRLHLPGRTSRSLGDTDEDVPGAAGASVTGENRGNPRRVSASPRPSSDDCTAGKVEAVTAGRVFISGHLEVVGPLGYQADSAAPGQERAGGQRPGPSEIWQRLQPVVECGSSAMTVTLRRRRASQVLLDRANESSVPLSRPPPRCGYSVQTTWRDLRLMAQYDACHVTRKHGTYELPLRWRETPVKVSCPVPHPPSQSDGPLSVCCSTHSMSVRVQEASDAELLRVNVRGQWTPLVELIEPCGFTLDGRDGELNIAAPFITCGIAVLNGKYTLSIQLGDKKFMLACPVSTPEEPTSPPEVVAKIPDPPAEATKHSPESLENFVWSPPFYLAPPLYPHPPYNKYHHPYGHDPSISFPPTPASTFAPPSFPPLGYLPEYPNYLLNPDFLNKYVQKIGSYSPTGDTEAHKQALGGQQAPLFGVVEQHRVTPSPPSSFPAQVESPSFVRPTPQYHHYFHHPNIPLPDPPHIAAPAPVPKSPPLAPVVPYPDASQFNVDQFVHSQPDLTTQAQTAAPRSWYPAQPYWDYQWYLFPPFTDNNALELAPFIPDLSGQTNVSSQQPSVELKPDNNFAWSRYEPPPDGDVKSPGLNAGEDSAPEQSSFQSPSFHSLPLPHHFPYHYYQMFYGPERSLSGVSQTPANVDPELKNLGPRSMFPLPDSTYDLNNVSPDRFEQPEAFAHELDVPDEGDILTQPEPRLPSGSEHAVPVPDEEAHPSGLQVDPSHDLHPPHISEMFPDGEAPDDLLDSEIQDFYLEQYLSFPVPDAGAESTAPSHSDEFSGMTGTLQRLTSDPDTYVDEFEENPDMETLLAEYSSHQRDLGLAFLNPARLLVEYGSPGEVRLRSANRPARSTEASAQLSIPADQAFIVFSFPSPFSESPNSFNRAEFHPEGPEILSCA